MTMKKFLIAGSALAVLAALPVSAGHGIQKLRGAFPAQHGHTHHGHYVNTPPQLRYVHQQAPMHVAQASYAPQSTYVTHHGASHNGLRGLSVPGGVTYSQSAANAFHKDVYSVGGVTVKTNADYTGRMLDWQENLTGKTLTMLTSRANGALDPNSLYLGGGIKGGFMWQKTENAGQFPILSRFPFFSERTDTEAGVFAINNAALAFTSTFGDWTTVYMQPEYSETEYPGDQDEFQLRKAFVVFGNLNKSPFYAAFGRKTIDFGNFDSYNAFTHNEGAHYFLAHSDQPVLELGYYNDGWKIVGSAFSGGRQLRVAYAEEENNIANYAFNIEKEFLFNNGAAFTLGGGYLHDTIYRNNWTAHTFQAINTGTPPANFIEYRNSAVNAFAEYTSPFLDLMVEYTTTTEPWAAAIPQNMGGFVDPAYLIDSAGSPNSRDNINFDQNLEVLVAQARIKPIINGRQVNIAATTSWGNIGDDFVGRSVFGQPTTWEKNQQHALSFEYPVSPYLEVGAEYVYNKGFIPFVAPQQVSDAGTDAHAIQVGFKARF